MKDRKLPGMIPETVVHVHPDRLEAALKRLGNPGTRDESYVFLAASVGISALRGEPVRLAEDVER